MGAALIVKPGLNRHFSVIAFGLAQVAMDIEPGIGMLTGANVLHGPTHTLLGALIIALIVLFIAPVIYRHLIARWNTEVIHYKLAWLIEPTHLSKTAAAIGAFVGTMSHIALDSMMHQDMHPLAPFSQANPLMGFIAHDGIYQLCAVAGVIGAIAWVAIKWVTRGHERHSPESATKP